MTPLEIIEQSANTPASQFVNSPLVTEICDMWRKERQENIRDKKCSCGNDCTGDELETLGFFGEYICRECV